MVAAVLGGVGEDVADLQRREPGVRLQDQCDQPGHARRGHAGAVDVVVARAVGVRIAQRRDDVGARAQHRRLHLVEVVGVPVRHARALVGVARDDVVGVIERVAVLERADAHVEIRRGRARHVRRVAVVAGGDAHDDARAHGRVHLDAIGIGPVGRGRTAQAHVHDLHAVQRGAGGIGAPDRVAVRDAPFERLRGAAALARIGERLQVDEPRVGRHAGVEAVRGSRREHALGPAAADRRARDVGRVIRAFGVGGVFRVHAAVGLRVQRRIGVREVAAAEELAAQRLMSGVRRRGRGIVHARVDDADHDAAAGVAELAPHGRKQAGAHAARARSRAQRARRIVVARVHRLPRLDARDAAKCGERLHLRERRARAQVGNVAGAPQQRRARGLQRRDIRVARLGGVAHVHAVEDRRRPGIREDRPPRGEVVADVRRGEPVQLDALDPVVDTVLVLVPHPRRGRRRRREHTRQHGREQRRDQRGKSPAHDDTS